MRNLAKIQISFMHIDKEDEMGGWIDTREREPETDGRYLIQDVTGEVWDMEYTPEGGWNTHYDSNGIIYTDAALKKTYVARWFEAPAPEPVPYEWYREWLEEIK